MGNKITAPSKTESRVIRIMILLGIFSIANFLYYFFQQGHIGNKYLFIALSIAIVYGVAKKFYIWYNYSYISVPVTPELKTDFKVDILTTYFPGEPRQMVVTTLEAICNITYPHTTYLCDEANDNYLKNFCRENGIIHVTRNNRIDAKAGNINNTLYNVATGEICVILDPDHIPEPNFLDPILPHFQEPSIGFVQIVQSYYNIKETLVARGAAEQTFQFYGPIMMSLNSYGTVNAIGANCVFRRKALDSIGGHAAGLCEDMHTAMQLYSKKWKSVYLPQVLAKGLSPSNLTNFFKQQLKWSRGTFDLLVKVYPKVFRKLTFKQKIHFGILPMHYLAGIICLINFLIPIFSLFFSVTPWKGNILDFAIAFLPVALSSLLIRTFIQKWVIEKEERGFHIIGGLLQINTWWIYIVGLAYTIIDKKVPYLPTPKENEWNTNYKIIIPNLIVAALSVLAVIYGLYQDLTPYSLMMAGFALFNAGIMLFGIYLASSITNENRILRSNLKKVPLIGLAKIKQSFAAVANVSFVITRKLALPLLLLTIFVSFKIERNKNRLNWEEVESYATNKETNRYLGIFYPTDDSGLSSIPEINQIEDDQNIHFNLISIYLAWNKKSISDFPDNLINSIYQKNAVPMITWEPWGTQISNHGQPKEGTQVLKQIARGDFDGYIQKFVDTLKSYDRPVFLRFAHEFDNPQYPWSSSGNNTPQDFKAAWRHVYELIRKEGANKIVMVWNPWKAENMEKYYPGDEFIDWIGITALNYDFLNSDKSYHSFKELYYPFHKHLKQFKDKPVMLAEFGSLNLFERRREWIGNAIKTITTTYPEIASIVFFDSSHDKNIPANNVYTQKALDWTLHNFDEIKKDFIPSAVYKKIDIEPISDTALSKIHQVTNNTIKGVKYNKGENWMHSYYGLTKKELIKDFSLMKSIGINTIQISENGIYDYNLLKYSEEFRLNIIYKFKLKYSLDFTGNNPVLNDLKEDIIDKVKSYKGHNNIIAYSFDYQLENYFYKPLLFSKQAAYLKWLKSVIEEVKAIDPAKPIIIELNTDNNTLNRIGELSRILPADSYGLDIYKSNQIEIANQLSKKYPVFINSMPPNIVEKYNQNIKNKDVVLANWQDERRTSKVSFNGLINFYNDKKRAFGIIKKEWKNSKTQLETTTAKVLIPSVPIYPGQNTTYQAMIYKNNTWAPAKDTTAYKLNWTLIKYDKYGNPLAIKNLGEGSYKSIKIPENYKYFELLLTYKEKDSPYTSSSKSKLFTPLFTPEKK